MPHTPAATRGISPFALAAVLLAVAMSVAPPTAQALVLDPDDETPYLLPPDGDPGWDNVGRRLGGPSLVYMGGRWILTAHHVGAGVVLLGDERYDPVRETIHRILNEDGSPADLLLFQIDRDPGLPGLALADRTPRVGEEVTLIGMGAGRGARITVDSRTEGLLDGFHWGPGGTKRWGRNVIAGKLSRVLHEDSYTIAVPMIFDSIDAPFGIRHEASAAEGDSGGALLSRADALDAASQPVLSGVLFSVTTTPQQPPRTSLYGNVVFAADVATYRDQLLDVIGPACPEDFEPDVAQEPNQEPCRQVLRPPERPAPEPVSPLSGPVPLALFAATVALLAWRLIALLRARG